LLHDFGKIGVREHVLVKAKKLYPAQLEAVKFRFKFIKRALELRYSEEKVCYLLERNRAEANDNYEKRALLFRRNPFNFRYCGYIHKDSS